jgi:hypothetical protein
MFRYGLKENIKDELIRSSGIINLLDILIGTAIDINDKLYKRAIEKKYNFNPRGIFGFNSGIKDNRSRDPIDLSTT